MVLSTLQLSLALALSPGECSFFHSSYTAHRSTDIFRYSYTYTHAALNSTTPKGFKWPCTFFFCSVCPFYLHLHSLGLDELRKGARKGAQAVVLIWAGKSGRRWGSLCLRHLFVSVSRLVCCSPVHYIHPEILSIHTHSIHTHCPRSMLVLLSRRMLLNKKQTGLSSNNNNALVAIHLFQLSSDPAIWTDKTDSSQCFRMSRQKPGSIFL
ncbi:MAG: hypothetical protein JOS17DRAFT_149005 [Linnemannia elongata]|nr:MAG: hypothetical protein JOS17DRAFT_149005 [Linnemannia elongata]